MTPSELIRAGIADIDAYARRNYKTALQRLSAQDRVAVMTDLEDKKIESANGARWRPSSACCSS